MDALVLIDLEFEVAEVATASVDFDFLDVIAKFDFLVTPTLLER